MNIKLITHTGADISILEANSIDVALIYDIVSFNEESYKNILEITPNDFYKKLKESKKMPTSSHATVGEFYEVFKKNLGDQNIVLFLCVTSKMSGTYDTAISAKNILDNEGYQNRIFVYDTLECSVGMAKLVRKARELVNENLDINIILEKLEEFRKRIKIYFVLDSLKYASMGGRVGKIKALAADSLKIKPLLSFDSDGYVHDIKAFRGFDDGVSKIIELFKENADFNEEVIVFHEDSPIKALEIRNMLLEIDKNLNIRIDEVGPVIGLYTGPGGVGVSFINK